MAFSVCKGECEKYKAIRNKGKYTQGRYSAGQKRCQSCSIYLWWDGLYCPCCNIRLRTKPRNRVFKAKYHARVGATT